MDNHFHPTHYDGSHKSMWGLKFVLIKEGPRWGMIVVSNGCHDDVIKRKPFPRYWLFVRGIHRSSVDSPPKGQWRRPLMFSLICTWTNGWANNQDAGDLRHQRTHYDVIVMWLRCVLVMTSPTTSCHFIFISHKIYTLISFTVLCCSLSSIFMDFRN